MSAAHWVHPDYDCCEHPDCAVDHKSRQPVRQQAHAAILHVLAHLTAHVGDRLRHEQQNDGYQPYADDAGPKCAYMMSIILHSI